MPSQGIIAAFLATAGAFFALGAYYQHFDVLRNIQRLERRNPHAHVIRRKLYGLLSIFNATALDESAESEKEKSPKLSSIMKYGFPSMNDIRLNDNYVISFDRRNSAIHWLCERVVARQQATVGATPTVAENNVALSIPTRSGQRIIRLANTANKPSAVIDTSEAARVFFLSNIKPFLTNGFNLKIWEKLQSYVYEMAAQHGSVIVYSGSIYLPKEVQSNNWFLEFKIEDNSMVAVPTHFFKIIIIDPKKPKGVPYAEAFVVPNSEVQDDVEIRTFLSDIRDIENATGLRFFEGLERNFVNNKDNQQTTLISPLKQDLEAPRMANNTNLLSAN